MGVFEVGSLVVPSSDISVSGFVYNDIESWYSGSDMVSSFTQRNNADGSSGGSQVFYEDLIVSLSGVYVGTSPSATSAAKSRLAAMKNSGRTLQISLTDEGGKTSRYCNVASVVIPHTSDKYSFKFSIHFACKDPLRYGPTTSISTGLTAASGGLSYPISYPIDYGISGSNGDLIALNSGTEETFSTLEITGGMSGGFELTEISTGNVLRLERPIPQGSVITVNPRTGRASMDGPSDVSRYLTRSEFWSVPAAVGSAPGVRTIHFDALGVVTGTPTLTAHTAPAYR